MASSIRQKKQAPRKYKLRCCVPNCLTDIRYNPLIKPNFHRFPKDPDLRKQWVIKIGRDEGFKITDWKVVCSKHFRSEDYRTWTPVRKSLKPNVVPSIFDCRNEPQKRKALNCNVNTECEKGHDVCKARKRIDSFENRLSDVDQHDEVDDSSIVDHDHTYCHSPDTCKMDVTSDTQQSEEPSVFPVALYLNKSAEQSNSEDMFHAIDSHSEKSLKAIINKNECYPCVDNDVSIDTDVCEDENEAISKFQVLKNNLKHDLIAPYCFHAGSSQETIEIVEMYSTSDKSTIRLIVTIDQDFCAKVFVHRKEIPCDHDLWTGLPAKFDTTSAVLSLLSKLLSYSVCGRNSDEDFQNLVPFGSAISDADNSINTGYRESDQDEVGDSSKHFVDPEEFEYSSKHFFDQDEVHDSSKHFVDHDEVDDSPKHFFDHDDVDDSSKHFVDHVDVDDASKRFVGLDEVDVSSFVDLGDDDDSFIVDLDHTYCLSTDTCNMDIASDADQLEKPSVFPVALYLNPNVEQLNSDDMFYAVDSHSEKSCDYELKTIINENECYPCVESDVIVDTTSIPEAFIEFQILKNTLKHDLISPYCFHPGSSPETIEIVEMYPTSDKSAVKLIVTIDQDFCAKVFVHRKEIPCDHDLWTGLPAKFDTTSAVLSLLSKLLSYSVCSGNFDEDFLNLVPFESAISDADSSINTGYREGDFHAKCADTVYNSTVRSTKCQLLVHGLRCGPCSEIRTTVTNRSRSVSRDDLIGQIKEQTLVIKALQKRVRQLKRRLMLKRQLKPKVVCRKCRLKSLNVII